jgi:DNA-binding protein HU-beta
MINKQSLVEQVAEKTGLTKKDATSAVDALFEGIQSSLKKIAVLKHGKSYKRKKAVKLVKHIYLTVGI